MLSEGTQSKENSGLKIDSRINSIPAIRVSSGCLNCQTSARLSVWCFSQELVISFFWFFAQWEITGIVKNWLKMTPNYSFLDFLKSFVISFSWKWGKMKIDIIIDISLLFPHLAKFCFSSYEPKYCWQIKLQDSLKCNIARKKRIMNFIFGMQINTEFFYKLILSFWVCVASHAQSTQNKKFTYPCISPKNVGNEFDFLPTNKYQNFLQIDNITLRVQSLPFKKHPK